MPSCIVGPAGGPGAVSEHEASLDLPVKQPYDRPGFKALEKLLLTVLKYVDDNLIIEKLCFD